MDIHPLIVTYTTAYPSTNTTKSKLSSFLPKKKKKKSLSFFFFFFLFRAINIIISSPLGWLWALARVYVYLCITPFPCTSHYLCITLFPYISSYASYIKALHCIVLHTLQYTEIIHKSNMVGTLVLV